MKKLIFTLSLTALFLITPLVAEAALSIHAQSPEESRRYHPTPENNVCSGGDRLIYDGGELWCQPRRFDQAAQAARFQSGDALRGENPSATRRTSTNITRTFYTHPAPVRAVRRGGFDLRDPASRRRVFTRKATQVSQNLRALRRGQRGQGAAATRQDRSPRARMTNAQRRRIERQRVLHSARRIRTGK